MKWPITLLVLIGVMAPGAYAIGQARDPRVPALQRKVAALNSNRD